MQTVAVTCCVLLMTLAAGGVWGRSLDDEDLFDRDADAVVTKGKTLKKLVTAANNGIDTIIKSTTDKTLKADLTRAKAGLAQGLTKLNGNVARSLEELAADDEDDKELERRRIKTQFDIGRGWSLGLKGLQYRSRNNRFSFGVRPSFNGFTPNGFRTSFQWRF